MVVATRPLERVLTANVESEPVCHERVSVPVVALLISTRPSLCRANAMVSPRCPQLTRVPAFAIVPSTLETFSARCRIDSACDNAAASTPRTVSIERRARSMDLSGSTSRFACAAAVSSRAVATRAWRTAFDCWLNAKIESAEAMIAATAKMATRPRRRLRDRLSSATSRDLRARSFTASDSRRAMLASR